MNWNTRSLLRMAWAIFLFMCILSACTHHSGEPSSSSRITPPLETQESVESDTSSVEQQLLATVKDAERLGPGNPLLLSSLYSLATYYEDRKEYDKAANQYERALTLKEAANGPNHPDVAAILQRYARLLQEAKRPSEAANLLLRADAILARSSSPPPRP
jgi:tetratricopeptide (TPR) repeat protein